MSQARRISRRTVLRGLGTAISLPLLDAMLPPGARAGDIQRRAPTRMAFVYLPNGMHMPDWTPLAAGRDYELPHILQPLGPHKSELLVLSGLAQQRALAPGEAGGAHSRALSTFLTGQAVRKTHGADIRAGVSVDQVAAAKVGQRTKFASLELGCDRGSQAGNCDSGYSCAYSSNISWRTETTPQAKEVDPRLAFDRLFADGVDVAAGLSKRERYRKSILDLVLDDARDLHAKLGAKDRAKLDEYLTSVRDLERRIVAARPAADQPTPDFARPSGIPSDYAEHIRLMYDVMVLAFQGDLTRVSTFVVANEGSNRPYPSIDVRDGHHDLSHHGGDPQKHDKIRRINHFHMTHFAYFLTKLRAVADGERTLLDNSMIVYGSGIGDGDAHNHDNLPILLAGRGGATIATGRHVRYDAPVPLNNLYLSMLDRMESSTDSLGDSTGRLDSLT